MKFNVSDLGRLSYTDALAIQQATLEKVVSGEEPSTLLLVEHYPVLTLGASFHEENLLFPIAEYERRGIEVHRTDRGGDVTYHGPGQLVAYPIFNLEEVGKDLHKWLRNLEECVITMLLSFGLEGYRFPPNTGVWVNERKVCAMGIKVRKWVSMHGLALNCDVDLTPFGMIIPCGIRGHGVTSLSQELGRTVHIQEVRMPLIEAFEDLFR